MSKLNERAVLDVPCRAGYTLKPKSVISVMMITTLVFVQMSLRFEGAMGFHCNRKTERQMTKRTFSLSQMSNDELAQSLPWRENEG